MIETVSFASLIKQSTSLGATLFHISSSTSFKLDYANATSSHFENRCSRQAKSFMPLSSLSTRTWSSVLKRIFVAKLFSLLTTNALPQEKGEKSKFLITAEEITESVNLKQCSIYKYIETSWIYPTGSLSLSFRWWKTIYENDRGNGKTKINRFAACKVENCI